MAPASKSASTKAGPGRRALYALAVSVFGGATAAMMTLTALAVFLLDEYGVGFGVGLTLALGVLPNVLLGPIVGEAIDRWDARSMTSELWHVQLLVVTGGAAYVFGVPARLALRPAVMEPGSELQGNSIVVSGERLSNVAGPALAGALIAGCGVSCAPQAQAAPAVLGAVTLIAVPRLRAVPALADETAMGRSLLWKLIDLGRAAFGGSAKRLAQLVRADSVLRALTITAFTYVFAIGMGRVFLAEYSRVEFTDITGAVGYLFAAMGAGGAIGSVCSRWLGRFRPGAVYVGGNALEGVAWILLPFVAVFPIDLVIAGVAAALESAATVVFFTEVQTRLDERAVGRYFAMLLPLTDGFLVTGAGLGGLLLGMTAVSTVGVVIGVAMALPVLLFASSLLLMGRQS